jgi:hypothetical protein
MTLEETLRNLAANGELSYVSLAPCASGFGAVYSPASQWGNFHARHADPVQAILDAVAAAPKKFSKPARAEEKEPWE